MPLSLVPAWLRDDWTWIRLAVVAACIAAAYLIWYAAFQDWTPGSADLFTIGALAFGVFSAAIGALNWFADANPTIDVLNEEPEPILVRGSERLGILQLRVDLSNVPRWMRPLVLRESPEGCEIRLWYARVGNPSVPLLDADGLLGRWNDNDEPVDYGTGAFELKVALRNRRLPRMYPLDTPYTVAFAIKAEGEVTCYHWNDQSYQPFPRIWRNPDWELDMGRYEVSVQITGYRLVHPARARFLLINDGPSLNQFRVILRHSDTINS